MNENSNSRPAQIILGIDPGSQNLGFGLVALHHQPHQSRGILHTHLKKNENPATSSVRSLNWSQIEFLKYGVVVAPQGADFFSRLAYLANALEVLMSEFQPDVMVVERIFLGKNVDSAFKLGHIRGVCIATALKTHAKISEYAARTIKKGITGNGAASKDQVAMLLLAQMGLKMEAMKYDATDALALAFYHAQQLEIEKSFQRSQTPRFVNT